MTTTVEVKLDLPDALAQEVARMGLLEPDALQTLLREAVRARRIARLGEARRKVAAAGADLIVSGDPDLLNLKRFHTMPIVTPRQAVKDSAQ